MGSAHRYSGALGGGWRKPYTVFFKICDESEIIVYVMPG